MYFWKHLYVLCLNWFLLSYLSFLSHKVGPVTDRYKRSYGAPKSGLGNGFAWDYNPYKWSYKDKVTG